VNRTLARSERIAWARLARTPRVGPVTFHGLVARFGAPAAALADLARRPGAPAPPSERVIEAELDALESIGAQLLASCEPAYPALLKQLSAPPPILAVRGDAKLLSQPTVAIVGAREASAAARLFAERLAADLGGAGYVVVSGLARGVDAAAHHGALASGTAAVLAGGLDRPYPPQNLDLHEAIAAGGAVVSEAPMGFSARARDFPRRNHVISGLSRGVVVIEAALRSGSLITARAAADQGRDVMAAPGGPLDPRARGANSLIKTGAALIESADDVLAVIGHARDRPRLPASSALFAADPPAHEGLVGEIARLISSTPVHINDIARIARAPAASVAAALVELELEGRAASLPGGYAALSGAGFS